MRRFFSFSVRDLFWLTLVVAAVLGWGVRELHFASTVSELQTSSGTLLYTTTAMATTLARDGWSVEQVGPTLHIRPLNDQRVPRVDYEFQFVE